jgi:branched-subunit amino acid ABC-type transport system permease component
MEFHSITLSALGIQFLAGLSRAMVYFIVASGLTLVFGVLRIINLAHGSFYMIGAFVAYTIISHFGSSAFWVVLLIAPLLIAFLALAIERGLLKTIYDKEHILQVLVTLALVFIFEDAVKAIWGAEPVTISAPAILSGSISIFGFPYPRYYLLVLFSGPIVAVGLWFLLNKTKIGIIARATAEDREMVGALGVNAALIFAAVFVIGAFLSGLGGVVIAPIVRIGLGMDMEILVMAFLIVIIGGLGNVWGVLLGAIIIGEVESFGILFWPELSLVFAFIAMAIIMIIRPTGLLKSVW